MKKEKIEPTSPDSEKELASGYYNDPDTATVKISVNRKRGLVLAFWTKRIPGSDNFMLVAKLFNGSTAHRAWASWIRDYIDMTHVRNYILKDCENWFDSEALMMRTKFFERYRYERAPEVIETYVALI